MNNKRPQSFGPNFPLGSPYGPRVDPMKPGKPQFHSGQDYPARAGIPIPAAANGTVVYSGLNDKSGNTRRFAVWLDYLLHALFEGC